LQKLILTELRTQVNREWREYWQLALTNYVPYHALASYPRLPEDLLLQYFTQPDSAVGKVFSGSTHQSIFQVDQVQLQVRVRKMVCSLVLLVQKQKKVRTEA
jgi:hypothetical protein